MVLFTLFFPLSRLVLSSLFWILSSASLLSPLHHRSERVLSFFPCTRRVHVRHEIQSNRPYPAGQDRPVNFWEFKRRQGQTSTMNLDEPREGLVARNDHAAGRGEAASRLATADSSIWHLEDPIVGPLSMGSEGLYTCSIAMRSRLATERACRMISTGLATNTEE